MSRWSSERSRKVRSRQSVGFYPWPHGLSWFEALPDSYCKRRSLLGGVRGDVLAMCRALDAQ
jgi:hypothetical protein